MNDNPEVEEHTTEDFPPLDEFPNYDKVDSRTVQLPDDSYEGDDE